MMPRLPRRLKSGDKSPADLFEHIAVEDIQHAADVLKPVYDKMKGDDGFVSLEVSPYLANDTKGTVTEAERLWASVKRPNLMVKVPATPEGLPAIQQLIGEGISINVTLLFAQKTYVEVAEAYLNGLEKYVAGGGDPSHVASVASFFVSRIDAQVDKQLDDKIAKANDPSEKARLKDLKGKVAIANAKLAYQEYLELFAGPRWEKLKAKGAKPQRLLWASTGVKSKDYRDTLYVEELIGKNTVNTVPPATLDAFRDHGEVRDSLEENVEDAKKVLADLAKTGISLDAITTHLVEDGVKLFADAADKLYGAVAHKRATSLGNGIGSQKLALGDGITKKVATSTEEWRASAKIRRLWHKDKSVWTGADEDKWLGWLNSAFDEKAKLADYNDFAKWVKAQGFTDAVVLGMGGSSLGPEVLAQTFAKVSGFPKLHVLDSTDPAQVARHGRSREDRHDAVHRLQQIRRHDRAECDEELFLRRGDQGGRRRQGRWRISSPSPIPAHRWRRSPRRRSLRASSMATRPSAGAIRCCRRSASCRRLRRASTSPNCWISRCRWSAPVGRTCRPLKIPACSSASRWAMPASTAATRSRSCPRRRSPISAHGPNSSLPNPPARMARA